MKIVVLGGTGLIGAKTVNILRERGHTVLSASRNSGVDTITGKGLAEALAGAEVVVDVTNSASLEEVVAMDFFTTSTTNVLVAEHVAGVEHHVALSILGADQLTEGGYFRAKLAQERLVREADVPYSIVHATPFFEFVDRIADQATEAEAVRLASVLFQPMAAIDVASAVADVAEAAPTQGVVEIAGPEQFRLDDLVRIALADRGDPRAVVADAHALYFGAAPGSDTFAPGDRARLGRLRFEQWLRQRAVAA